VAGETERNVGEKSFYSMDTVEYSQVLELN
jgi:hypothetical protein